MNETLVRLYRAFLVVVIGLMAGIAFHWTQDLLGNGNPNTSLLLNPANRYSDFINPYNFSQSWDPYVEDGTPQGWERNYFPLGYFVFSLISGIPWQVAFLLYFAVSIGGIIAVFAWVIRRADRQNNWQRVALCAGIVLGSYPVLFAINRGNIELLLLLLCFTGIALLPEKPGYSWRYFLSIFFLSVALGMKPYPMFFLPLFISRRRWLAVYFVILFALIWNLLALHAFQSPPILSLAGYVRAQTYFRDAYLLAPQWNMDFAPSLYYFVRLFSVVLFSKVPSIWSLYAYLGIAAALTIAIGCYVAWTSNQWYRRVYLCAAGMLLLPPWSADYRLPYLLIPFAYLLILNRWNITDRLLFLLTLLLLIPKHYLWISGISIATPLNILALLTIVFLIFGSQWFSFRRKEQ